jgi:hypothetical protein
MIEFPRRLIRKREAKRAIERREGGREEER